MSQNFKYAKDPNIIIIFHSLKNFFKACWLMIIEWSQYKNTGV